MTNIKNLFLITIFFSLYSFNSFASDAHFINYSKVLNSSKPGAEAQKKLKTKFIDVTKKFKKLETDIIKEESEIISQKKVLSADDYKKKVKVLRKKVADLQKSKRESFDNIAQSRRNSKKALQDAVNPIIKKYMEDNNIRLVLNKKDVIMGDKNLEITDQVITILNKALPSLKKN